MLARTDTCTVSNAIEAFNIRMRNEGFVDGRIRCLVPGQASIAGYAVTGSVRTTAPPIANLCYYHRTDWWEFVASVPSPKIIVLEDVDRIPGTGAFVGEIHARIAKALGCVGFVSNGTVRDFAALRAADFQCFASGISVSHSYAHIVDYGESIKVGGLKVATGDLLQGDRHGIQNIPYEIAGELAAQVDCIVKRERELIEFIDRGSSRSRA